MSTGLVVVVAVGFALVNGANDGGTIVATGLRSRLRPPWLTPLVLVLAVALAPLVLGSPVARTLAERLVGFEGDGGVAAVVAAVVGATTVVLVLAARGLPTSLTLGLVGAIGGAGWAAGLPVDWLLLGVVLAVGVAAPVVGLAAAVALHHTTTRALGSSRAARTVAGHLAVALQSLAYGVNDGQKMLAVVAVLAGTSATLPGVPWGLWTAVVAAFAVGTVVGVARVGPTVDTAIVSTRPVEATQAQLAGAVAVLGSAALASPVSLTQAVTGALVGTGVAVTPGRVRWLVAVHLALAWTLTLPSAFAAGALLAPLTGRML